MPNCGVKAELAPFFKDMPARMAAAHLVIARSGAGTVSELAAIGRPAILVPLPHALDDNQTPNADALADAGGGWRVAQKDLTPQKLAAHARRGVRRSRRHSPNAPPRRARLASPDATQRLADLVEKLGGARMTKSVRTRVPLDIGAIHFIGIGGIGMSGIAEIMHNLGYKVQGSDAADNANVKRLRAMGIPVSVGHAPDNLKDAHVVVYSSAVKPGNVEFDAARLMGLPLVRRAEMLAEIMRLKSCIAVAGTNGKTTTTTLVAALLDAGGIDPTVVNGGIINAYGTNARLGAGRMGGGGGRRKRRHLPAPARHRRHGHQCRSRSSGLLRHLRHACATPSSASSRMCRSTVSRCSASTIPKCRRWSGRIIDRRLITYGFSPQADVRAVNVRFSRRRLAFRRGLHRPPQGHRDASGRSAPAHAGRAQCAEFAGRDHGGARAGREGRGHPPARWTNFRGVGRRFTKVGEWNGAAIIDDYAHNPFKIAAALKAARQAYSGPDRRRGAAASLHPPARHVRAIRQMPE